VIFHLFNHTAQKGHGRVGWSRKTTQSFQIGLKYHGEQRIWQNWSKPAFCDMFNEFTFAALSITKCYAYNQINSAVNHLINQSLLYYLLLFCSFWLQYSYPRLCPTIYSQNLAYFHFTQPNYKYNAFPPPHTTLSWANRPYYKNTFNPKRDKIPNCLSLLVLIVFPILPFHHFNNASPNKLHKLSVLNTGEPL